MGRASAPICHYNVVVEFTLEEGTEVLSRTPDVLDRLLRHASLAWRDGDEGPGTWSPRHVVGHLVHLEEVDWLERTRVILEHDGGAFRPIDREGGFERYADWSLDELLGRFATLRAANLDALGQLVSTEDLDRAGAHPDFGEVTLRQLLATWVVHDLNHLGQVVKAMAKQYRAAVGPWRAYLPILDAD